MKSTCLLFLSFLIKTTVCQNTIDIAVLPVNRNVTNIGARFDQVNGATMHITTNFNINIISSGYYDPRSVLKEIVDTFISRNRIDTAKMPIEYKKFIISLSDRKTPTRNIYFSDIDTLSLILKFTDLQTLNTVEKEAVIIADEVSDGMKVLRELPVRKKGNTYVYSIPKIKHMPGVFFQDDFSKEGFALFCTNNRCAYINKKGEFQTEFVYSTSSQPFREGFAMAQGDASREKFFLNRNLDTVFYVTSYDVVRSFQYGITACKNDQGYDLLDTTGRIIAQDCDSVFIGCCNQAIIRKPSVDSKRFSLIGYDGKTLAGPVNTFDFDPENKVYYFDNDKLYNAMYNKMIINGVIGELLNGKMVKTKIESIKYYDGSMVAVMSNGKWAYYEVTMEGLQRKTWFKYHDVKPFVNKTAKVCIRYSTEEIKWGVIDSIGYEFIPVGHYKIESYNNHEVFECDGKLYDSVGAKIVLDIKSYFNKKKDDF